jgi:signal transduction histidine kinase/ActR/RegA family two-component response regulator
MPQRTIRRSVTAVALLTTFTALLVNAAALLVLDIVEFRGNALAEARTQAEMLARASAAAVAFNDAAEAGKALGLLRGNPSVTASAVYSEDGRLFASFAQPGENVPALALATREPLAFEGVRIAGFHTLREGATPATTVYLSTRHGFYERLSRYLAILAGVLLGALGIAALLSDALQRAVSRPIQAVIAAARQVVERHDYGVRVDPQPGHETALLAEAFNKMLSEIERRSREVLREIKEREHAEEALREADARKDRFLATLAHELRNPLAPITTSLELLNQKNVPEDKLLWARKVIDRQVRHMARLLDDLLDVGRITNDKLELRRQTMTLASVIDAALEASRPAIEGASHKLEVSLPSTPVYVEADPVRLAQVFSNLLTNAAKYTDPGGRIMLSAQTEGAEVFVSVTDTGIGVAPGDLNGLFEIFAQSGSARERAQGGLGIGLYLVKSLTEMHGGSVHARSEGLGKGTRFTVRLPRTEPAAQAAIRPAATLVRPLRVLVADDNRDAAESLAALLRMSGNDVRVAGDGEEALAQAAKFRPHVAFLDIGMPRLNGYEAARKLRATPWGRRMVLVGLTGWGGEDVRRRAFESGLDHHVTKPAQLEVLQELLRKVPYDDASTPLRGQDH